jgi:hypothetical protein
LILAFDPGDVRVGFAMASYSKERRKLDLKICTIIAADQLYNYLGMAESLLPENGTHTFVIENFRNDQLTRNRLGKSVSMFQWNEMLTSQMIGTLKYAAFRMNDSPVTLQEPGVVLSNAKRWAPFKWPKGHLPDDKSAYCHLAFYAMNARLIDTVDDILQNGQEKIW